MQMEIDIDWRGQEKTRYEELGGLENRLKCHLLEFGHEDNGLLGMAIQIRMHDVTLDLSF